MKRSKNGIWTLTEEEMLSVRSVFAFADVESALTASERELLEQMRKLFRETDLDFAQISMEQWEETKESLENWERMQT